MLEYYFLYAIAFIWIVFATVQDLKTTEIANWLSFSLIAFVLAYRAFYASLFEDVMFFVYGLMGVLLFVVLGYIFYYGKVFAGGDAKLLMGLGGIWPYAGFLDYLYIGLGFIFVLFIAGAIYTLVYSLFLISRDWNKFGKEFKNEFGKNGNWFYLGVLLLVVFEIILWINFGYSSFNVLILILVLLPLLFIYTRAVEKACMIKLKGSGELVEGDWLEKEVKIGKKVIRKSVHGLSSEEIKLLRRAKRKVWVKDGVPFTPAFLIGFLIMVVVLRYSPF